jgi:hypothetical protein
MRTARIRATTFPIRYGTARLTSGRWRREIWRAIRTANRIYRPHNFHFELAGFIRHLSYNRSMTLLTHSVEEESRAEGISRDRYFQRERRIESRGYRRTRYGVVNNFRFGGFLLRAFPMGSTTPTDGSLRQVSREALQILRLNRRPGEITTYWIPGFNRASHGLTLIPEFQRGVTRANESIFISYRTQRDILAHELGHLLMRAGHCNFEGQNGSTEGSAPTTNLITVTTMQGKEPI